MSSQALIDSIVQQTTVLIAHLATRDGERTPVTRIANRVFLDLTAELQAQGVAKSVIADMFGMALRTYHRRLRALRQSVDDRERSVWEAVLDYVRAGQPRSGLDVQDHLLHEDPELITGVLRDLTQSGLLYRSGRGPGALYRVADSTDLARADAQTRSQAAESLVWVQVYRHGPIDRASLTQLCHMDDDVVGSALVSLQSDGRVLADGEPGAPRFQSPRFDVPVGDKAGWEAAVLDHHQALVSAMCVKLRMRDTASVGADVVGGATYTFDVGPGHPLADEARELLSEVRHKLVDLRNRVDAHNLRHGSPDPSEPVTFYAGQYVPTEE